MLASPRTSAQSKLRGAAAASGANAPVPAQQAAAQIAVAGATATTIVPPREFRRRIYVSAILVVMVLCVMYSAAFTAVFYGRPDSYLVDVAVWTYVIFMTSLVATKFFFYYAKNWHFFMLDFCYFHNWLLIAALMAMTMSCTFSCVASSPPPGDVAFVSSPTSTPLCDVPLGRGPPSAPVSYGSLTAIVPLPVAITHYLGAFFHGNNCELRTATFSPSDRLEVDDRRAMKAAGSISAATTIRPVCLKLEYIPFAAGMREYRDRWPTKLLRALWGGSFGTLLGAIVMWKVALIVQDYDRMTSFIIHIMPAMVHSLVECVEFSILKTAPIVDHYSGFVSAFGWLMLFHYIEFAAWNVQYFIGCVFFERVLDPKRSKTATSSYTWLMESPPLGKKGPLYRAVTCLGMGYTRTHVGFILMQAIVHLVFFAIALSARYLSAAVETDYPWGMVAYVGLFALWGTFNGANLVKQRSK